MRYAVLDPQTNYVENLITAEEGFTVPDKELVLLPEDSPVDIGYVRENGEFIIGPELAAEIAALEAAELAALEEIAWSE